MPSHFETFVETIVRLNVEDALTYPNDSRRAFNACASIEALASHLYWLLVDNQVIKEVEDTTFKSALAQANEAFALVHDIAEAQKHGRLTRPSSLSRKVRFSDSVRTEQHGWDLTKWDELLFDVNKAISVEVEGEIRTVPAIVRKALNFLDGEILLSATGESCVLTLRPELAYTSQP